MKQKETPFEFAMSSHMQFFEVWLAQMFLLKGYGVHCAVLPGCELPQGDSVLKTPFSYFEFLKLTLSFFTFFCSKYMKFSILK